jgi:hypothetical protein
LSGLFEIAGEESVFAVLLECLMNFLEGLHEI